MKQNNISIKEELKKYHKRNQNNIIKFKKAIFH